jgi:hypothetical protein
MEVAESLKISLSRPNYPSVPTWWVVSDFAFPDAPWAVSSLLGTGDLKGEKEHNHNKMNNNHKNNHKNNTSLPRRKARAKNPQQPKILGSRTKESHTPPVATLRRRGPHKNNHWFNFNINHNPRSFSLLISLFGCCVLAAPRIRALNSTLKAFNFIPPSDRIIVSS